jgi:hypothetical protein
MNNVIAAAMVFFFACVAAAMLFYAGYRFGIDSTKRLRDSRGRFLKREQ